MGVLCDSQGASPPCLSLHLPGGQNFEVYPGAQPAELKGPVSPRPEQNSFRKVQGENAERSKLVGVSRDRDLRGAGAGTVADLSSRPLGAGAPARALRRPPPSSPKGLGWNRGSPCSPLGIPTPDFPIRGFCVLRLANRDASRPASPGSQGSRARGQTCLLSPSALTLTPLPTGARQSEGRDVIASRV